MKHGQQQRNAQLAARGIGRADKQRGGRVDQPALGKVQMLPQVGGIGVLAPAGGTKLLVMQPHHGRSKQGQRRKAKSPQQPLFTGLRHVSLHSLIQLCSRSVSPTMGAVSGRVTSVPPFSALVCASSARGWVCSVSVPSAARVV